MEVGNRRFIFQFLIFITLLVLGFDLICLFSVFFLKSKENRKYEEINNGEIQWMMIEEKDNIFSSSKHSSSNFGMNQYRCTGSCVCEYDVEENEQQQQQRNTLSSSSIVSKSITVILASLTASIAYNIAKDHFEKECYDQYSQTCPIESIISSVDDCSPSSLFSAEEDIYEEDSEEMSGVFSCEGRCLRRHKYFELDEEEESFSIELEEKEDSYKFFEEKCNSCKVEGEVELEKFEKTTPEEKFKNGFLRNMCEEFGVRLNIEVYLKLVKELKIPKDIEESYIEGLKINWAKDPDFVSYCVFGNPPVFHNPTIRCKRV